MTWRRHVEPTRMTKMDSALEKLVNQHIAEELRASHVYLALSAYLEDAELPGMAEWMRQQANEERTHAMKFYKHLVDRGNRVVIQAIPEPAKDFKGPRDAFDVALKREVSTTKSINKLYDKASDTKDYPLQVLLDWFVTEQVEEEQQVRQIVDRLERVGDDGTGLVMLDRELGQRGTTTGD